MTARQASMSALVLSLALVSGLAGCGDRWARVEASDVVGDWAAQVGDHVAHAEIRTDGTVRFSEMPGGVFCAGPDHRVSDEDWSPGVEVVGRWEFDEEYQDPGSMPLAFRDERGCWANAYVIEDEGALAIEMFVGPPTDGSTIFEFRRSGTDR